MPNRTKIVILLIFALLAGCSGFKKEEVEPTAEEMYAIAKKSLGQKNWLTAIDQLRELEAKYPYGVHAEQAQLDTIYAHHRSNQPGLAIAAADRFIKLHPAHESVDYAYYIKGLANSQEKDSLFGRFTGRDDLSDRDASVIRDALNSFTDVYTLFPDSRYAADARARAHHLTNDLAKHELAVATYYFSRSAYVAVVNRAKNVIEDYATTPSVEEALALLVFSYREMGLDDLSNDSKRVLALNFPESEYLDRNGTALLMSKWDNVGSSKKADRKRGFFEAICKRIGKVI